MGVLVTCHCVNVTLDEYVLADHGTSLRLRWMFSLLALGVIVTLDDYVLADHGTLLCLRFMSALLAIV